MILIRGSTVTSKPFSASFHAAALGVEQHLCVWVGISRNNSTISGGLGTTT